MSDDLSVQRSLGAHEARISALEVRQLAFEARIDGRLDRIESRTNEIHEAITGARGGWRAIAWVAGISSTVAAAFGALYHFFVGR